MDETQRLFYRKNFQVRFLRSTATEFQNLFSDIMQRVYKADFQKVRPYGKHGDLKCDGFLSSKGAVYQCYAPRELKEKETIHKIKVDYPGAKKHWRDQMKQWVFVHNDNDGLPGGVVRHLHVLKTSEKKKVEVFWWSEPELIGEMEKLDEADLVDLFGPQPTKVQSQIISFPELQTVLTAISKSIPDPEPVIKAPSPEKIAHNNLSEDTTRFLHLGRHLEREVQKFLEKWPDPAFADQIAETFRNQYDALRNTGLNSEEIFVGILRFCGFNQGNGSAHNTAVLAVVSYFFERCDIFEDPDAVVFSA
ncbi:MAG: hypothetical protein HYZ11_12785 [Candidatus Tectomicrobia bacterium]|uniref:ABC-three component systems C-terminal domain-containing protein n=1 Tax=Tectimicrobiota bacterium TaxID=2528274 RepID=A0A932HZA5_UNCTE|nr:hypothetical protein [Candidatus Tectomicrobia bacterium]